MTMTNVEHAEASLRFVEEVNELVSRCISLRGHVGRLPLTEFTPEVWATAMILLSTMLSLTNGDYNAIRDDVWPQWASSHINTFTGAIRWAEEGEDL